MSDGLDISIEEPEVEVDVKSDVLVGPQGPQGKEGKQGEQGIPGEKGEPNVLTIGTVTKGDEASAEIVGDTPNQVLNLVLPKGDKGDKGEPFEYEDFTPEQLEGLTPQKGVDYFTEGEKQEVANEAKELTEIAIQPTLQNNLKSAKDYTDNAIVRDFKDITFDSKTMTIVLTRHDNTTFTIDLPIENTVKNGRYDADTQELVLILVSGQEIKIPASGLIDDYDGLETATIQCVVSADNKISCNIKAGSITKTLLTTELQNEIDGKLNKSAFVYDEETETLSITI